MCPFGEACLKSWRNSNWGHVLRTDRGATERVTPLRGMYLQPSLHTSRRYPLFPLPFRITVKEEGSMGWGLGFDQGNVFTSITTDAGRFPANATCSFARSLVRSFARSEQELLLEEMVSNRTAKISNRRRASTVLMVCFRHRRVVVPGKPVILLFALSIHMDILRVSTVYSLRLCMHTRPRIV